MIRTCILALLVLPILVEPAWAEITRIWLTHRTNDPSKIMVNWETAMPGGSVVRYGTSNDYRQTVAIEENVTLHHVRQRPRRQVSRPELAVPCQRGQLYADDNHQKSAKDGCRVEGAGRADA